MDSMDPMSQTISEEDLRKHEEEYNRAGEKDQLTDGIRFNYAWCLIKSDNSIDIKRGVGILNELCRMNTADRRDYMYYLAIGYAKLKIYEKAIELLDQMLRVEPNNHQVLSLKKRISKLKTDTDIRNGALATGVTVGVAGTVALIGYGIIKALNSK